MDKHHTTPPLAQAMRATFRGRLMQEPDPLAATEMTVPNKNEEQVLH